MSDESQICDFRASRVQCAIAKTTLHHLLSHTYTDNDNFQRIEIRFAFVSIIKNLIGHKKGLLLILSIQDILIYS